MTVVPSMRFYFACVTATFWNSLLLQELMAEAPNKIPVNMQNNLSLKDGDRFITIKLNICKY